MRPTPSRSACQRWQFSMKTLLLLRDPMLLTRFTRRSVKTRLSRRVGRPLLAARPMVCHFQPSISRELGPAPVCLGFLLVRAAQRLSCGSWHRAGDAVHRQANERDPTSRQVEPARAANLVDSQKAFLASLPQQVSKPGEPFGLGFFSLRETTSLFLDLLLATNHDVALVLVKLVLVRLVAED